MILDGKVDGTLDQGNRSLIIFDKLGKNELYGLGGSMLKNYEGVLDALNDKIRKLKVA